MCNSQHTLSQLDSAHYQMHTHIEFEQLNYALKENSADIFAFVGEEYDIKSALSSDVQKALILFEDEFMLGNRRFILLKPGQEDEQFKQLCFQADEIQANLANTALHLLRKECDGWKWTRTYSPDFYMDRHFYPLIVDKNKLRDELLRFSYGAKITNDFFVFSGTDEEALYKILRINEAKDVIRTIIAVFLDEESAKEKFDAWKCLIQDGKSIHWLKVNEMDGHIQFLWNHSKGTLNKIRFLLVDEKVENATLTEATFAKSMERVVILADEPGMGKTMTLIHIGEMIQNENPHSCVIRIDLNQYQAILASTQMETLEDLVDLLLSIDKKLHNPLMHCILKRKITCPGHMVLLCDGFDEVKSDRQNSILRLLMFLQRKTTAIIWVTTRRHDQKILEDSLSVLAHLFVPLNESEQINFLTRFWETTMKLNSQISNISELKCHAVKVIKAFEHSIQSYETHNFICIPLRARLLAEIYQQNVEKALINKESLPEFLNGDENLNIGDLYKQFIARKYDIFLCDKANIGEGLDETSKILLLKRYSKAYGILAIKILFDPIFIKCKEIEFTLNFLSRFGLIQGNEEPVNFIHRTFAEYFAGKFLAKHVKDLEVKTFLNVFLFKKEFEVVRRFFDYSLAQNLQLHRAVLKGNVSVFQKSLESLENSDIEAVDGFGRTALHLAAQEGNCDMIHLLQNPKNDKLSRDKTGKTALHYAAFFGHNYAINQILVNYIEIDVDKLIFRAPLHFVEAILNRLFDNPKYARCKVVKFVNEQDEAGKTPLNYAADNEYWYIALSFLLCFADCTVMTREQNIMLLDYVKVKQFTLWNHILVPLMVFLSNVQSSEYLPQRNDIQYKCFQLSIKVLGVLGIFCALFIITMNKERRKLSVFEFYFDKSVRRIYRRDEERSFSDTGYLKAVRFFLEQCTEFEIEIDFDQMQYSLAYFAEEGFLETAKYLYDRAVIKRGVFENLRNFFNKSNAVQANKKITVYLFCNIQDLQKDNPWLQNLISINCEVFGWTLLHLASMNKNVKSIDDFLNPPVYENINRKDRFGNTPLHYAAKMPFRSQFIESLFATLRARNLNDRNQLYEIVNAKNNKGKAPLDCAIQKENFNCAKVLLKSIQGIGFNQEQLFNIFNYRYFYDLTASANLFLHDWEFIEIFFNFMRSFNLSSQQCIQILEESFKTLRYGLENSFIFQDDHYQNMYLTFVNCIHNLPFDYSQRLELLSDLLYSAAKGGAHYEIIQSLLKNGAVFDAYDSDYKTPLDVFPTEKICLENVRKNYFLLSSIERLFELIKDEEIISVNEKLEELKEVLANLKNETWIDPESILNARNRDGETLLDLSKYEEVTNLLEGLISDIK